MKTYSAKPTDVVHKWYLVDAAELPLGRLATIVAQLLMGKGKPMFTHHIDCGDYVVVINASNLQVSGNKLRDKQYYRHSGYPGALKASSLQDKLAKDPASVITQAVRGMLPVNKLRPGRLQRLKVYGGSDHNHEAQKPQTISLKNTSNRKKS